MNESPPFRKRPPKARQERKRELYKENGVGRLFFGKARPAQDYERVVG
jgi:hypothetical protein